MDGNLKEKSTSERADVRLQAPHSEGRGLGEVILGWRI